MNLSRRAFVGGAAAFGVAVAAPKFAFAEPSAAEKQAEADAALQKLLKLNSDLDQKVKDYAAAVDAHDAATAKMDECQAKIDDNNERMKIFRASSAIVQTTCIATVRPRSSTSFWVPIRSMTS